MSDIEIRSVAQAWLDSHDQHGGEILDIEDPANPQRVIGWRCSQCGAEYSRGGETLDP